MGLRTLGAWESSGRHGSSGEAVSDSMGKVFPVSGLRKVDGNLGWSRARGGGGAVEAACTQAPPTAGVAGSWGRGCQGSLFWPPDGWTTESQCLGLDGRFGPSPAWFCGCFLVSARKPRRCPLSPCLSGSLPHSLWVSLPSFPGSSLSFSCSCCSFFNTCSFLVGLEVLTPGNLPDSALP